MRTMRRSIARFAFFCHLLVVGDDDRPIGIISIGDLGKAIIDQQEFTIAHLEHYISGAEASFYRSS